MVKLPRVLAKTDCCCCIEEIVVLKLEMVSLMELSATACCCCIEEMVVLRLEMVSLIVLSEYLILGFSRACDLFLVCISNCPWTSVSDLL